MRRQKASGKRSAAERLQAPLGRLAGSEVGRRELTLLLAAIALGVLLRVAYVVATHDHPLAGDEPEYYLEGLRATQGRWFWTDRPFDVPHAGMWKSPGYPVWVSVVYSAIGVGVGKLLLLQTLLLGPAVIFLVWLLARRLFDSRVAVASALVGALYPHMWQWEGRLYPEAFALPLGLLLLVLVLECQPTPRRAAVVGVVMAASLYVRPTAFFLFAGVAVGWWMANEPRSPYAWRVRNTREAELFDGPPIPDAEFRSELQRRALDYIKEHPDSLPKAFFWNGLSRTWDIRRPQYAIEEVAFEGRNRNVSIVGIAAYYVLLAAALVALWRLRARRALVYPLLAMALAASAVFTSTAATRYRLPLEPMIVILACTVLPPLIDRRGRLAHSGGGR